MCSGSEAGSYLRLIDFVYHPTLVVSVIKKKRRRGTHQLLHSNVKRFRGGLVFKAHRLLCHSTLGLRVIKKKKRHAPGIMPMAVRKPCKVTPVILHGVVSPYTGLYPQRGGSTHPESCRWP